MKSFFNWGVKKEVERLKEEVELLSGQLYVEWSLRSEFERLNKEKYKTIVELRNSLESALNELTEANTKLNEYKLANDLLEKELMKKNKQLEKIKEKLYSERRDFKIVIKELEKELSKRYIVKTLKPTKPVKQVMNIKNGSKQSKIIKKIKEEI